MQSAPPPAPPPVYISPADMPALIANHPIFVDGKKRFVVIGLALRGDAELLRAAQAKAAAEGWEAEVITDRAGRPLLSLSAEHRTLAQVYAMMKRVRDMEFGAVTAEPTLIPELSGQ